MVHLEQTATPYSKILQVSGPDAAKFLQGQLSCDVDQTPTYGTYCNIKGKVEAFFQLTQADGVFSLSMPDSMLEPTMAELQKYAVFSKVQLAIVEKKSDRDPEQEIRAKVPEVYPETRGLFFPHDLNLPAINAVSFTKGCYRGQEIVARMQHRGNLKRSLYYFTSDNLDVAPSDGIRLINADQIVGTVVRTLQQDNKIIGLAVINDNVDQEQIAVLKLARSL